jgi:hypothetical protein
MDPSPEFYPENYLALTPNVERTEALQPALKTTACALSCFVSMRLLVIALLIDPPRRDLLAEIATNIVSTGDVS